MASCFKPFGYLGLFLSQAYVYYGAAALSSDGLALLQLKHNLVDASDGAGMWSWNESDDTPCGWLRVTCGPDGFSVSRLELRNLGLQGTLSISLGSLANLTYLDLSINHLVGPISPEIMNCTLLTSLHLNGNNLSGSIPDDINQLGRLEYLDLSSNSLTGSVFGLDDLTSLRVLMLQSNRLSGRFPSVDLLTNLTIVKLGPQAGNNFTTSTSIDAQNLQSLEVIVMPGCGLEGPLPSGIAKMPNLSWLDLSHNQLNGNIPRDIWAKKILYTVDLSSNRLNGRIPRQLLERFQGAFRGFSYTNDFLLNLSSNSLNGTIPGDMITSSTRTDSSTMLTLDLSNNQLEGPIPAIFSTTYPYKLWLHNNRLSGDITSVWSGASMASNYSEESFGTLGELQLQGNRLREDIGAATCAMWRNLKVLDLSDNIYIHLVNDSLSIMLDTFLSLVELRLSNIGRSGRLPARNRTFPFQKLEVLDLSRSGLEGDLAKSFMADANYLFPSLRVLDLSGNRLRGPVPVSLTKMPKLVALNLSNNSLSGELPLFPERLFNATFFAGNLKLCGPPLDLACDKRPRNNTPVFKLSVALLISILVSAAGCLLSVWRLRVYSARHQQDAELIAALQDRGNSAILMSLADLRRATSNFSDNTQIGEGGFGTVYKGKLSDGTLVAIKKSKRHGSQRDKDQFLNEVKILSQVHHRNLVRLLACCLENKIALLVFEFVPNGTLQEHLRLRRGQNRWLTWTQRLRIALQTAHALAYLHSSASPPIFHRDVKSANILLDEDTNAKVADFGISRLVPVDVTHVSTSAQGTIGYIDPEYYTRFQLSAKSDVYSFGVVLLELLSGRAAVDLSRGTEDAGLARVAVPLIKRGEMQDLIDPIIYETYMSATGKQSIVAVGHLAVNCLEQTSQDRPTMTEVWKELQDLSLLHLGTDAALD